MTAIHPHDHWLPEVWVYVQWSVTNSTNDFTLSHAKLEPPIRYFDGTNEHISLEWVYVQWSVMNSINDFTLSRPIHQPPPPSQPEQSDAHSWAYVQWYVTDINDFTLSQPQGAKGKQREVQPSRGSASPSPSKDSENSWAYVQWSVTNINDFHTSQPPRVIRPMPRRKSPSAGPSHQPAQSTLTQLPQHSDSQWHMISWVYV
jgi:hypothetical protein